MKKLTCSTGLGAVVLLATVPVNAATCSCATVPLLGSMETASPSGGNWLLGLTYEYHDISDLISGSTSVPDETGRDRSSQALIIEASRGLSEHWSVSFVGSLVDHDRRVGDDVTEANGPGDAIAMLKYTPLRIDLYSRIEVSLGIGARIPLGADNKSSNGIVLAEDMQPGTGAWGTIAWAYAARGLNEQGSARVYGSVSHTNNGENDRDYRFGHETTAAIGTSYQTQTPWGFSGELVYRHTKRDERATVSIPNTGGEWLDFTVSAQYHLNEKSALRLGAKIPVERNLNDALQFTTKFAMRLSFTHVFGD